jgi:hypothetical protein
MPQKKCRRKETTPQIENAPKLQWRPEGRGSKRVERERKTAGSQGAQNPFLFFPCRLTAAFIFPRSRLFRLHI